MKGSSDLVARIQNAGLCVGCGACVGICPYFKAYRGKVVMTFSCDRNEGRCYAHCPGTETNYDAISEDLFGISKGDKPMGHFIKVYASRSSENKDVQNGGTVTALMKYAMDNGMIDAAVLTGRDGLIPAPEIVTDKDQVNSFSSTKYMASPTVSKFNEAMEKGFEKIGVVGTPCQMTAIGKIKSNPLNKENFKKPQTLLIGLFCTWAVDTKDFIKLVEEKTDISKITGMEIPPPPAEVFMLKTTDGDIEIPLDEIRKIVPEGCSMCPDMTSEWCDVSVGAYEGKKEWNTLVIRTKRGEALVNGAKEAGYIQLEEFPEENLKYLSNASSNKKKRGMEKREELEKQREQDGNESDAAKSVVSFR